MPPLTAATQLFFIVLTLAVLLWTVMDVLLLTFAGILFAVFLHALANWLSQWSGRSYRCCLAIVVIILVALAGAIAWNLTQSLLDQVHVLQETLPKALDRLRETLRNSPIGNATLETARQAQTSSNTSTNPMLDGAATALTTTLGGFASLLYVLFLGLFLAIEPALYRNGFLKLIPQKQTAAATALMDELGMTLRWWLVGTLFSMSVIGFFSGLGLWLLGIPIALLIGILTALLTFIPTIGPLISIVLPALMALLQGPYLVLYVVLLYLGIQFVETYFLTPLVQRRTVNLPPALVISSQFLMGMLSGAIGVMLATPLAACALVLVKRLYVEQTLGKESQ